MEYPIKSSLDRRIVHTNPAINAMISQIDQLRGEWTGGVNLGPQVLGRLKKSALITSAGASTRIEGAKLSDAEIERLINGLSFEKMADRDSQEVRGYYETLKFIYDSFDDIPISENYLFELHLRLLTYSTKDTRHRGVYKKLANSVKMYDEKGVAVATLFETSPPLLTEQHVRRLVDWFNDEIGDSNHHPLFIIAGFLVEFLRIHPFQDGNGRLSRLLTDLLMLRAGFAYVPYSSHSKIIENNKAEYYIALRRSQVTLGTKHEDITPWVEFFLRVCLEQAKSAVRLLTDKNVEKTLSYYQLTVWEFIKKVGEASIKTTVAATDIERATVKQAYAKLVGLKLVERVGEGRSSRYRLM
jgi:Fic family protein